jgi:hypothetical protein
MGFPLLFFYYKRYNEPFNRCESSFYSALSLRSSPFSSVSPVSFFLLMIFPYKQHSMPFHRSSLRDLVPAMFTVLHISSPISLIQRLSIIIGVFQFDAGLDILQCTYGGTR